MMLSYKCIIQYGSRTDPGSERRRGFVERGLSLLLATTPIPVCWLAEHPEGPGSFRHRTLGQGSFTGCFSAAAVASLTPTAADTCSVQLASVKGEKESRSPSAVGILRSRTRQSRHQGAAHMHAYVAVRHDCSSAEWAAYNFWERVGVRLVELLSCFRRCHPRDNRNAS
jgi:hypothetical protein